MTDIARLGMAFDPRYVPVKVKRLHPDAVVPQYQTEGAAGFDLHAVEDVVIEPGETKLIRLGLAFEIPPGYVMFIMPRSGVSLRTKLRQPNSVGVIDSDYRGEVKMMFDNINQDHDVEEDVLLDVGGSLVNACDYFGAWDNFDKGSYLIRKGDRIAQGVIQAVPRAQFEVVDELSETERGTGGFGSTGVGEDE